jgi:dihydroflavonol-4-reductase
LRVFLTGGTGLIGSRIAAGLRQADHAVVALVRDPKRGANLRELGCQLAVGALSDHRALEQGMAGCQAVIHCAAIYELGVPRRRQPELYRTNVLGTRNALLAARKNKVKRFIYVSSVVTFGNTKGALATESFVHHGPVRSYYEQTKVQAERLARHLGRNVDLVTVLPASVYGPGDRSQVGNTIRRAARGQVVAAPPRESGYSLLFADDAARGIILALETGTAGERYILAGQPVTLGELLACVEEITGKRARVSRPGRLLSRLTMPVLKRTGRFLGLPPNLPELINATSGYTYWASGKRAERELGFSARPLRQGLTETLAGERLLPQAAGASVAIQTVDA